MKKQLLIFFVFLSATVSLYSMDISGNFTMDNRFSTTNGDFFYNQENGSLKFEQQVDDNLYGMAKIDFIYYNSPSGSISYSGTLDQRDLFTLYSLQPLDISLDQAYFIYQDLMIHRLDLTAGKQRINWGTADRLNPTDLLNPNDFSDPFDFGKKIPTLALNAVYHFSILNSGIQAVFEPYSQIALMNPVMQETMQSRILDSLYSFPDNRTPASVITRWIVSSGTRHFNSPATSLSNYTAAAKNIGT